MHNFTAPAPPPPQFWETWWGISLIVIGVGLIALRIYLKKVRGI